MPKAILRKLILVVSSLILSVGGASMFAAFEAHIVNVTAKIENALAFSFEGQNIRDGAIDFGTVFPQEYFNVDKVKVALSDSFLGQDRVSAVNYKIEQKPKCVDETGHVMPVKVIGYTGENNQPILTCPDGHQIMPLLCPYISKKEITQDGQQDNDVSVPSFHKVIMEQVQNGFTVFNEPLAKGQLIKGTDEQDTWEIDLAVPCFKEKCSQDWPGFVQSHNPEANSSEYELDNELESERFGCDLWFEVTDIFSQST